jgi:hypothetical protein
MQGTEANKGRFQMQVIKITEKELVHLGWDDPGLRVEDPELHAIVRKIRTNQSITSDEFAIVQEEINGISTFGMDPAENAIAKRLVKKINAKGVLP